MPIVNQAGARRFIMAIRVCKKHGKLYGEFIEVEFDDRVHGDKCPLCGSVSPMNDLWKWITRKKIAPASNNRFNLTPPIS